MTPKGGPVWPNPQEEIPTNWRCLGSRMFQEGTGQGLAFATRAPSGCFRDGRQDARVLGGKRRRHPAVQLKVKGCVCVCPLFLI